MSLDEGNYSGPAQSSTTINGASFDVFTFTYQGDKTQSTIDAGGDPWEDSEISTTIVPKTDACVPMRGGVTYYTQWTGSWTTANGTSGSIPAGWIPTRMARQDVS